MSFYKNRYASLYQPDMNFMRDNPQADKEARDRANAWKQAGAWAGPVLGLVGAGIGAAATSGSPGGMAAGGQIGNAVGQGVSGIANDQASQALTANGANSTPTMPGANPPGGDWQKGWKVGADAGGATGGALGQNMNVAADETLDPIRMRELKRQALMEALRGYR